MYNNTMSCLVQLVYSCVSTKVLDCYYLQSVTCFLTHWGGVTHICVGKLTIVWSPPNHYLHQWWNIVNWTPRNKLQGNSNRNSRIFSRENPFQNALWKKATTLSRSPCVNIAARSNFYSFRLLFYVGSVTTWSYKSRTGYPDMFMY